MGWKGQSLAVDVSLHLAAFFALVLYFWNDWIKIIREGLLSIKEKKLAGPVERRLFWYIIIATIPAAAAGLIAGDSIEVYFRNPVFIAAALSLFAVVLYTADLVGRKDKSMKMFTVATSFVIGLFQALAVIPGVSRSGITISGALFLGFNREAAVKFSFLLSAPVIFAAGIFKIHEITAITSSSSWASFAAGFVAAFLSSIVAIRFLLDFVRNRPFTVFVIYRLLASAVLLSVFMLRR
jgi:undecaprenyl-diphosphatase